MLKVRVYGMNVGNSSWKRVTEGIVAGLEYFGCLAGAYYYDVADDDSIGAGFDAPVALFVGRPDKIGLLRSAGDHQTRIFLLAPNSTWVPSAILDAVEQYATHIATPSRWGKSVLESETELPVMLLRHGVFEPDQDCIMTDPSRTRFLHMTSTQNDRKSTRALIDAWHDFRKSNPTCELTIVCGEESCVAENNGIKWVPRLNYEFKQVTKYIGTFDYVVQPSRAEGFGLVPLESLATGVPVVMTGCTGHSEYVDNIGVVRVQHGGYGPINDGPGAMAPLVDADDIVDALRNAVWNKARLSFEARAHASTIAKTWAWHNVMLEDGFVSCLKEGNF